MPIRIEEEKCCYAKGTCSCLENQEKGQNNPLTVVTKYCVTVCPFGALSHGAGRIEVDEALCTECGECVSICCSGAIRLL